MYAHWLITQYRKRLVAIIVSPLQISAMYWTAVGDLLEAPK